MAEAEDPKKDDGGAARASPLIKSITSATILLYALGWGTAFAWQSSWDPGVRASYGYQLGWLSGFAACAAAILLHRAHQRAHGAAAHEKHASAEAATTEGTS